MTTASLPRPTGGADLDRSTDGRRSRLVIIGFGMVGYKLVERMSALDALGRYDVTIIGEESYPAYDRVRLTEWLNHRDLDRLALARPGWSDSLGIRVITGTPVLSIARDRGAVRTADANWITYDRLVLATGSAPLIPPIDGVDCDGVFVYRSIDDLERIRGRAEEERTAIVIGGGLLGLETADALRRLGLDVVLLEAAPCLLSRQLDAEAAELLEASVHETGIRTITGVRVSRIETLGDQLALTIEGRPQPLTAGLVVMAAGIRPRNELARDSGLGVAPESGGIAVDDELRTTDPAIHAIGECASHHGTVYGLAAPGFRMAETLAEILAGRPSLFRGYTPAVRLRLVGGDVWSLGDQAQRGNRLTWRGNGSYRQITLRGRYLVAAASVGPWEELGFTQDAILQRRRIRPWQLQQFLQTGTFSGRTERHPVTRWPASATVCNCLEVTRGALSAAGCSSVETLAERTGASKVCGSCRPLLAELTSDAQSAGGQREREVLLATGGTAAALALLFAGGTPLPLATSLRTSGIGDVLYRDGWWRQATGFVTLGCASVAVVAVLALIPLAAHTGLRIGTGLNRALMVSFLAATVLGTAAAVGLGNRHARLTFWLHLLAVWPLPVLLAFHILSAYYF